MSEQKIEDVEAFKAKIIDLEKRIVELDSENQKLRQTLEEASKALRVYVDRESFKAAFGFFSIFVLLMLGYLLTGVISETQLLSSWSDLILFAFSHLFLLSGLIGISYLLKKSMNLLMMISNCSCFNLSTRKC